MKHEDKLIISNSSFQKIVKTSKKQLDTSQKPSYSGNNSKHSWNPLRVDSISINIAKEKEED